MLRVATYLFDFLYYSIPMWLAIAMICGFGNEQFYLGEQFLPFVLLFLLYGASSIAQTHAMSFFFTYENSALVGSVALYSFSGWVLFITVFLLAMISETTRDWSVTLTYITYLVPQAAFAGGAFRLQSYYYSPEFDVVNACACRIHRIQ